MKKLIARSMNKCELLYFSPQGKELQSVSVGHGNYAGAQLSPNGNVLLFELDPIYYMGVNCDYILYNIPENRLIYFNDRLWGNQLILDDNLICNTVGGLWGENYRFYDMEYQELGLRLDINRGTTLEKGHRQYPEIEITGLGHDRKQSQYYLTMSRDKTQEMGNQVVDHSINELLIGVYDQNGTCIKTIATGYRAPYSNNIQGVYRNFPAVLPDGKLLVQAHTQAGEYGERITLLIDPEQETVSPWKMNFLASGENGLVLMAQHHNGTHELLLMDWTTRKVLHRRSRNIIDEEGRHYWVKGVAFGKQGGYYITQTEEEYQALFYFSYRTTTRCTWR